VNNHSASKDHNALLLNSVSSLTGNCTRQLRHNIKLTYFEDKLAVQTASTKPMHWIHLNMNNIHAQTDIIRAFIKKEPITW
jgi:hypothetical protein